MGDSIHQYAQDSVLQIPPKPGGDDKALLLEINKRLLAVIEEGDRVPRDRRDAHIRRRLDELEKEMAAA